jgi:hypothetical protein
MAAVSELKARQAMVVNRKEQPPVSSRKTMAEAIQSYLKEVHTLRGQRSMERQVAARPLHARNQQNLYG